MLTLVLTAVMIKAVADLVVSFTGQARAIDQATSPDLQLPSAS